MIRKTICFIFIVLCFCKNTVADNYAILISAGEISSDNPPYRIDLAYWYDLFLIYEYLLLTENYDSSKVYVFYGDGNDFNSTKPRFNKALHNWGHITDYGNSYSTLCSVISSLDNVITDNDNLLFYWAVGHGELQNPASVDSYNAIIEIENNREEYISKTQLVGLINSITHYNKRKIIWMTCYSGAMGVGAINPLNNKTTLLTSAPPDSICYEIDDNVDCFSAFNFSLLALSTGKFPNGDNCDISQLCPGMTNCDSVFSIKELHTGIDLFTYTGIDTPDKPLIPELYDAGGISNRVFIGENIEISNVTIDTVSSYWLDRMELTNVEIGNNVNISIDNSTLNI